MGGGGGGLRNPKYVDILDPKSGLFELHPLTLLQTPIFAHFVAKSGAFGMGGGGALHPPHPPGYHNGPGSKVAVNVTDSCRSEVLSKELVTSLILIVEIMKRAEMGWNRARVS